MYEENKVYDDQRYEFRNKTYHVTEKITHPIRTSIEPEPDPLYETPTKQKYDAQVIS